MENSKQNLFFTSILFAFLLISSEPGITQDISQTLIDFNQDRIDLNTKGMYVLSGWAVTNIAIGTTGFFNNNGSKKYFHQMNTAWNIVNLAIAGGALFRYTQADPNAFNFQQSLSEAQKIENILLLNMA